ncbi:hypothetical protein BBJ28_00002052 [Nothophytophthora sp. Chile5]|nr:hypothetical protein BBJ28_00002052 [Nothophytophthora sp. Chile5]
MREATATPPANPNKRKEPSDHRSATPPAVRKLRKSCSLPTCSRPPGACMHCTCDGRCGRHVAGRCGGRREGSGRGCKREGCSRDDRCLHSNRATCCHCRNLVSSTGRAAKRPRVATSPHPQPQFLQSGLQSNAGTGSLTELPSAEAATGEELLDAEVRAFLRDANLGGDLALCEYPQWASRRRLCNLVVLVCGVQFNLHKSPMLLESGLLRRKARQQGAGEQVPLVELPAFPGGADVFEALAIYAYTGELPLSRANVAATHCAMELLEMRDEPKQRVQQFIQRQASDASDVSGLLQVVSSAQTLAQAQPTLFRAACEPLVSSCMDALAQQSRTLTTEAMLQLFSLPSAVFLELTQRLTASSAPSCSSSCDSEDLANDLCVQAQLAQLHREAQSCSGRRTLAQQCVQLLRGDGFPSTAEMVKTEDPLGLELEAALLDGDGSDQLFLKLMEEDVAPAASCFGDDSLGFGAHRLPETFVV